MIQIIRTSADNMDFVNLVKQLDLYLAETDGQEHSFYSQFNKIEKLKFVVVAYENGIAQGCGAMKAYDTDAMEIKRMYVMPQNRGKGIGSKILTELENWAGEMSVKKCILETGIRQPEAISLYQKNNYRAIPNYGQYVGVENSRCFEKELI